MPIANPFGGTKLTPLSMQMRNCCSMVAQAAAACPDEAQHPSTVDMMPRHGFISALFGRLTLRLGSGGNRGAPILFTAPTPDGFGTIVEGTSELEMEMKM
jgi:hypothetical protein